MDALSRVTKTDLKVFLRDLTFFRWGGIIFISLLAVFGFLDKTSSLFFIPILLLLNFSTYALTYFNIKINTQVFLGYLIFDSLFIYFFVAFNGGVHNPFAYLFLVQMAYSAQFLSVKTSWLIALYLTVLYASLFFIHFGHNHHEHDMNYFYHLLGMLITFALLCFFLVSFIAKNLKKLDMAKRREQEGHTLAMLGAFAAQAAHQMGTPLNSLNLLVDRVFDEKSESDKGEYLDLFKSELHRCTKILKELSSKASMNTEAERELRPVQELIHNVLSEWYAKDKVEIEIVCDDTSLLAPGGSTMQYALLNLIDNAYEAGAKNIKLHASAKGSIVKLAVEDDGPGFPTEVLNSQNFEHGLGLYLTHATLKLYGGELSISNSANGALAEAKWMMN